MNSPISNPETMSLKETVDYIMKVTGWTREKATKELLKKLQSGEVRAYGTKVTIQ